MATAKDREGFIARLVSEFNGRPCPISKENQTGKLLLEQCTDAARALMRHAKTHGRLACEACNGYPGGRHDYRFDDKFLEQWEAKRAAHEARIEARMVEILAPFGIVPRFGGDPRGYTVKIHFPSGAYNTWGGREEGYGVPQ